MVFGEGWCEVIIFGRAKSHAGGCFSTILFFMLAIFMVSAYIRGYQGPYARAQRIRNSDPCQSVVLFAEDIRIDHKSSGNSVHELSTIDSECAMREIVRLLDSRDGKHVGKSSREVLFNALKRQSLAISTQIPDYDPAGSLDTRRYQQQEWHEWLDKHNIKR